jgi:hypothetical protein
MRIETQQQKKKHGMKTIYPYGNFQPFGTDLQHTAICKSVLRQETNGWGPSSPMFGHVSLPCETTVATSEAG